MVPVSAYKGLCSFCLPFPSRHHQKDQGAWRVCTFPSRRCAATVHSPACFQSRGFLELDCSRCIFCFFFLRKILSLTCLHVPATFQMISGVVLRPPRFSLELHPLDWIESGNLSCVCPCRIPDLQSVSFQSGRESQFYVQALGLNTRAPPLPAPRQAGVATRLHQHRPPSDSRPSGCASRGLER